MDKDENEDEAIFNEILTIVPAESELDGKQNEGKEK